MKKLMLAAAISLLAAGCSADATGRDGLSAAAPGKSRVHQQVTHAARRHGVPPALAHGIVHVESRYDCRAKNPRSTATGAMQVLRGTARGVGVHGNLKDCATGIEAGMRYLKQAYVKAGGDWCGAATLYNRGTAARPVRSAYCRMVLQKARPYS